MFSRQELEKYASVLMWALGAARGKAYRRGEVVRIAFDADGLPLAEKVHRLCILAGLQPVVRLSDTHVMESSFYSLGKKDQLRFMPAGTKEFNEKLNGSVFILAPSSLTHLKGVDPSHISIAKRARKPFRDILWRREEKGLFGWTVCAMPTKALAAKAGLSLAAYAAEIKKACYLDRKDPVSEWKALFREAAGIKQWLTGLGIRSLRIESPSFDLKVTPGEKRQWIGVSGQNVPSFEIATSPDWRGTEGSYYSDLPAYESGNFVKGVRVTFKKGRAVKVTAQAGEVFAAKMLATDPGAKQVGEFSLTDRRFSRISRFMAETLYDENFGGRYGNCHIALGASYTDTYAGDPASLTRVKKRALGFNDSALHWDLVNTEKKTVTARSRDGKERVIYENGIFKI